jgi:hypothetical protein
MKIIQATKIENQNWNFKQVRSTLNNPLVLVFANRFLLEDENILNDIRKQFPYEHIVFGSTAGEIAGIEVHENSISVIAIEFEKSSFVVRSGNILQHNKKAKPLGEELFKTMPKENLKHLFVISEGSFVNGNDLIDGLEMEMTTHIPITGGLCGDDSRFEKTIASYKENPKIGEVVLIGFYGESLDISFASFGGWTPFGPERKITSSRGNVLFEIDGKPALDLYKFYLGNKASQLPKASLLYPLKVISEGKKEAVVRTILNISEENNAMILAGDVPLNSRVQLMMASVDAIAQGAQKAAQIALENRKKPAELALIVSCIGRKLVMNQRVEEEIERVQEEIGNKVSIAGFYSYGEIAPFDGQNNICELHNQTMTLTLISE